MRLLPHSNSFHPTVANRSDRHLIALILILFMLVALMVVRANGAVAISYQMQAALLGPRHRPRSQREQ